MREVSIRRVDGPCRAVVDEPPEVLETELLVVHREENEGVPTLVNPRWRRDATLRRMRAEIEPSQGVFEECICLISGQAVLLHETRNERIVLVTENSDEGRGRLADLTRGLSSVHSATPFV